MKAINSLPFGAAMMFPVWTWWLFVVPAAFGHDIWLHPNEFILTPGDTVIVRQLAGDELQTQVSHPGTATELPMLWTMTSIFDLITKDGTVDLLRELRKQELSPNTKPVLQRRFDFEGLALLTMVHDFTHTELSNETFLEYLEHEKIKDERFIEHMGNRQTQRERYTRTLNTLIRVGAPGPALAFQRSNGLPIEIVLLQNPYQLSPRENLEAQVLLNGKPLPDKLVLAYVAGNSRGVTEFRSHTDSAGIARFRLDRRGFWLIRLVHLRPCKARFAGDCTDVDWESYWASYTFELR